MLLSPLVEDKHVGCTLRQNLSFDHRALVPLLECYEETARRFGLITCDR